MFYSFLKVLVRWTLKMFFRKITITGLEHVSSDRPQLVASNHPNGFLEPLIMACFFPKPLHFLVRGDVFENPVLRPILRSTNQIPIFRFKDGFSKLRENAGKIDESIEVLNQNKNLLIFVEGGTESIKKLRPIQKGISRIAFQSLEKNPHSNLEILPVGINFSYPAMYNKTVMLRIGRPIQLAQYLPLYHADPKECHEKILKDVSDEMRKNIIDIEDQTRIMTFERLVNVYRALHPVTLIPVFTPTDNLLNGEQKLANQINHWSEDTYQNHQKTIKESSDILKKNKIQWNELPKRTPKAMDIFWLILGFVPAMIGLIFHGVPMYFAALFTKSKVKQKEFIASILMISNLILILIFYILVIIIIASFDLPWYILAIMVASGICLKYYNGLKSDLYLKSNQRQFSQVKNQVINALQQMVS